MVLFVTKRLLVILGGAIFTLLFDANPVHGLDRETSVKSCKNGLKALEQQKYRVVPEIRGAYNRTVEDLKNVIAKMKERNDPITALALSKECQDGLSAADWLINRYGKPSKVTQLKPSSAFSEAILSLPPRSKPSHKIQGGKVKKTAALKKMTPLKTAKKPRVQRQPLRKKPQGTSVA